MNVMHIVLHLVLCTAAVHGGSAVRSIHVEMDTRIGTSVVNQDFKVSGDNPNDTIVDLDAPRGTFLLQVDQPRSTCGAAAFVETLPDSNRSISLKLTPGALNKRPRVPTLFYGLAPMGFDYTEPTIVLLDGSVACDGPVGDPLAIDGNTENDSDSYYTTIYGYTQRDTILPKIALRVTDNGGGYHYIRMNIPISWLNQGWPEGAQFNISTDLLTDVIDKPEDTLLCLKLNRTSSG